eukprot:SAG11_NODE_348_length_10402_cov_8.763467_3_plen_105_part_00
MTTEALCSENNDSGGGGGDGGGDGGGGETSGMARLIPKLAADHPAIAALAASGHAADVEVRIVNSQLPVPQLLAELADATAISGYNGIWLAPREVPCKVWDRLC